MEIVRLNGSDRKEIAPLVAAFRSTLRGYKGIASEPDREAGETEFLDFLRAGYPVFAAVEAGKPVGYIACRIEEPTLWVEQIYVSPEMRRKGVASLLFAKAEEIASSMGEDTVFNYVHPNNDAMIAFLRAKGYTVLNLIEIRKPYKGEKLSAAVRVDGHVFDY